MPRGYAKSGINAGQFKPGVRQPEWMIAKAALAKSKRRVPLDKRSGAVLKCQGCCNEFYVYKCRLLREAKKGRVPKFCSLGCYSRKGENNYFWKNGRYVDRDGYIRIWHESGPMKEHRFVAETILGRKLRRDEVVHHINEIRDDNRPENLRVMTRADHQAYHFSDFHKHGGLLASNLVD